MLTYLTMLFSVLGVVLHGCTTTASNQQVIIDDRSAIKSAIEREPDSIWHPFYAGEPSNHFTPLEKAKPRQLIAPPKNDDLPVAGTKIMLQGSLSHIEAEVIGFDQMGRAVVEANHQRYLVLDEELNKKLQSCPQPFTLAQLPKKTLLEPPKRFTELVDAFLREPILGKRTPLEYISYLREHGYEVYLMGGVVRDLLHMLAHHPDACESEARQCFADMDVQASCAPSFIQQMFEAMHRGDRSIYLTYKPQSGVSCFKNESNGLGIDFSSMHLDPLGEDVKVSIQSTDGQTSQLIGTVFTHDLCLDGLTRDFCCNCIYYDPFNKVIIDPTGFGYQDAIDHRLRLTGGVKLLEDPAKSRAAQDKLPYKRFWKFRMRGYTSNLFTTNLVLEKTKVKYGELMRKIEEQQPLDQEKDLKDLLSLLEIKLYLDLPQVERNILLFLDILRHDFGVVAAHRNSSMPPLSASQKESKCS